LAKAGAASGVMQGMDAWHALLRDKSVQFQFPDADINTKPPTWLTRLIAFLTRHHTEIKWGIWVILGAGLLIVGWLVVRWLIRRDWTGGEPPPAPRTFSPWQPTARQARLLLEDADRLAAEGRFDDAVHLLLLVSIQEIGDRQSGHLAPSLTSREIARLPALSALAQRIFSGIAQVVERSLFGGRTIGQAEFAHCRTAFEQFTRPDAWQVAR
jgi:hypothetical protein